LSIAVLHFLVKAEKIFSPEEFLSLFRMQGTDYYSINKRGKFSQAKIQENKRVFRKMPFNQKDV
jgi:hypothetical protein